jgi:hypothetical protein
MCNCGNKREAFSSGQIIKNTSEAILSIPELKRMPDVNFKYTGKTGLSIRGTITGKNYRFAAPGEVQAIDYRDAPSMTGVPVLERVR